MKFSGGSRRVIRRASHARSARASTSPALYQCRLLALTLPTTTLFLSTAAAATSATAGPTVDPPAPDTREAHDTSRTDPRDRVLDDLSDASAFDDHVRLEAHARDGAGVVGRPQGTNELRLGPRFDPVEDVHLEPALLSDEGRKKTDRSSTGHEHGPRLPEGALADRDDLLPRLRDNCRGLEQYAQRPSERSTFMAYSGSIRQRSDMKPSISLMPRSVYWPFRHMSHSPTAQLGHGTGSGRRTMPTTRSPFLQPADSGPGPPRGRGIRGPSTRRVLPWRGPAVLALHDLDVGPANADRDGFDEDRPVAHVRLGDVFQACGFALCGSTVMAFISISPWWRVVPAAAERLYRFADLPSSDELSRQ